MARNERARPAFSPARFSDDLHSILRFPQRDFRKYVSVSERSGYEDVRLYFTPALSTLNLGIMTEKELDAFKGFILGAIEEARPNIRAQDEYSLELFQAGDIRQARIYRPDPQLLIFPPIIEREPDNEPPDTRDDPGIPGQESEQRTQPSDPPRL